MWACGFTLVKSRSCMWMQEHACSPAAHRRFAGWHGVNQSQCAPVSKDVFLSNVYFYKFTNAEVPNRISCVELLNLTMRVRKLAECCSLPLLQKGVLINNVQASCETTVVSMRGQRLCCIISRFRLVPFILLRLIYM